MSASEFYSTIDNVKKKLRIPETDDSITEELQLYAQEVDAWVETEVRKKIGYRDDNGDPIDINFTIITNPEIDVDIRGRADDLLEGKFRLKTTNDATLWDDARKEFRAYLDGIFGWGAGESLETHPEFTVEPETGTVGTTITITGKFWAQFEQVNVVVGGISVVTTPNPARADSSGDISATFDIPANIETGTVPVKLLGQNIPRGRTLKTRNYSYSKLVVT